MIFYNMILQWGYYIPIVLLYILLIEQIERSVYMKKYTYDFNFILENARWRDYLAFLILVLFITLISALLITKELKIFQILLIVSPFVLVTICGTLEYYQIQWYLIEAKQYREEDNYEDAFEIYDNI